MNTSVLSQQEKPIKKNRLTITNTDKKQAKKKIDYSDIPELNFEQLGQPLVGRFYKPIKKQISIRLDADVLDWFQQRGKYQALINQLCRNYMEQCEKKRKKKSSAS